MPCGSLVGVFFMSFWLHFGSLLALFGRLGRPCLDPGTTPGPFRARGAKSCEKVTIELWWLPGSPIWDYFAAFDDFLAAFFLLFFWVPIFLTIGSSGVHLVLQLAMFFGVPGTLGNRFKTLKGIRFSHFGGAFCKYDFQAGSWPISRPGRKKLRKGYTLVELWWLAGSPIWDYFAAFDDFLAACFLLFFWVPIFLTICSSGVHVGFNLWCFLGYLGPLEIGLKRWRGYDFHTLEVPVAGTICRLDLEGVFLVIFTIFTTFWTPFRGGFWGKKRKKESEKKHEINVEYVHASYATNSE